MVIIGITGGTGAGKTTALDILREMGALIIDCDEVYHSLLENSVEMRRELSRRFPALSPEGPVDRKKLGAAVFGDKSALDDLNAITHKYVSMETDRLIARHEKNGGTLAAIDAILLIESGLSKKCCAVVGVTAPESVRVERIMAREGISREYALSRIRAQKTEEFFRKNCDVVLINDKDRESFRKEAAELFKTIIERKERQ